MKPEPEIVAEPKLASTFKGKKYILEESLFGDFAIIKAKKADRQGNLMFEKTERNFNQDMAKAAHCVIAEVEEIVEAGELDPEAVHVQAVYVDRVFKSDPNCKYSQVKVERLTLKGVSEVKSFVDESDIRNGNLTFGAEDSNKKNKNSDATRLKIARRAAKEVRNGMNINLGIGIPTLLPTVLPDHVQINLESENGIMGVGSYPSLE